MYTDFPNHNFTKQTKSALASLAVNVIVWSQDFILQGIPLVSRLLSIGNGIGYYYGATLGEAFRCLEP